MASPFAYQYMQGDFPWKGKAMRDNDWYAPKTDKGKELTRVLTRRALLGQDAVNLSGIVQSFAADTATLWELACMENQGTEWVNTHPISRMWTDKLYDLAHNHEFERVNTGFREACAFCTHWSSPDA